jgi:hypothetical protein
LVGEEKDKEEEEEEEEREKEGEGRRVEGDQRVGTSYIGGSIEAIKFQSQKSR